MAKSQVLSDVKQDIQSGNLGLARQRLHSLVDTHPEDLSLRRKLGDIYHRLQYPERAGCYWYLEAKKTPEMKAACSEFVRASGGDPHEMLRKLKFRGEPGTLADAYARSMLQDLAAKAPNYRFPVPKVQPAAAGTSRVGWFTEGLLMLGCLVVGGTVVAVLIWGFVSLYMLTHGYKFVR